MKQRMKLRIFLCLGMLLGFSIGLVGCNSAAPFELSTVSKTELPMGSNMSNGEDVGTSGVLTASE